MSRVAKAAISLPKNVEVSFDHDDVQVKGPRGTLSYVFNSLVSIKAEENVIKFEPRGDHPQGWAQAGTARALFNNMVKGVTEGFTVTLELVGVGYRAQAKGNVLSLSLGFSHPIEHKLPEGVTVETPTVTSIVLTSNDKQKVGQVAAEVRSYRPPEPYKGKGVKYANETIIRKEAKKK